jgi:adenosylcobinamide-phosphate synthase
MDAGFVLILALAFDLLFGEPPNRWHPVALVGRLLDWGQSRAPRGGPLTLMAYGGFVLLVALAAAILPLLLLTRFAGQLGWPGLILQAWLLKCAFSIRGLLGAGREVNALLQAGDLEGARGRVGRHLVSRPTGALARHQVASAAVESIAENLTDSLVAPLCFYLVFGLPGAWAYRVINTADAVLGYREGELEHLGKVAARLDDLLNLIPARLAGFGIVAGAFLAREAPGRAWRVMWRDHALTSSPNAGWTMSAMAGALGVILEKPGHYQLGGGDPATLGAVPGAESISRALRVTVSTGALFVAGAFIMTALWR